MRNLPSRLASTIAILGVLLAGMPVREAHATGATIVVDTDAEAAVFPSDGHCSLREAIYNANVNNNAVFGNCTAGSSTDPDIITFAANYTMTLTNGQELDVTSPIVINGNGAANTIIQADASPNSANFRVFSVQADGVSTHGNLTLNGVTVKNGRCSGLCPTPTDGGGGILNSGGSLTISNSTVSGNGASGSGGGILNNGGNLTLTNSTISGNSANQGGGIYSGGSLTLTGSTLSANNGWGAGGAIYCNGGTVVVTNTDLSNNTSHGNGGAIFCSSPSILSITDSTLSGNLAYYRDEFGFPHGGSGGAIYGDGINLTATRSTISVNGAYIFGGGIYNQVYGDSTGGQTTLTNSTLVGNQALSGGGVYSDSGTVTLMNTTLYANSAGISGGGGGIDLIAGALNYANTIIAASDVSGDCVVGGTIGTNSSNLVQDGSCSAALSGDPKLGLFAYNGGPTQTMALVPGSLAINAGNDTICAAAPVNGLDQRGVARPQGPHCDIGAFEAAITWKSAADFNGDGRSEVVVYRGGAWLFSDVDTGAALPGVWTGNPGGACIPAPMDYDGDGTKDFTQLCGGAWNFYNDDGSYLKGIWVGSVAGQIPVPADYDGNGTDDVVVFRGGAWQAYDFATGAYNAAKSVWTGLPGGIGIPVPMDYNGDGKADPTILSGGAWHFFNDNGSYNKGIWVGNVAGQLPVPGDYNGDGTDDVRVFRGGAWLAYDFASGAYLPGSSVWTGNPPPPAGGGATKPAPLDYNGDGVLDLSVFAGGPWHFYNANGSYNKGIWVGKNSADMPISRRPLP